MSMHTQQHIIMKIIVINIRLISSCNCLAVGDEDVISVTLILLVILTPYWYTAYVIDVFSVVNCVVDRLGYMVSIVGAFVGDELGGIDGVYVFVQFFRVVSVFTNVPDI